MEAQHIAATMRLVDTLDEQAALEALLEGSKPALPAGAAGKHHLLSTPLRYRPRHPSRFRRVGAPGVWYGAAQLRTACAEVAYRRWRFLSDSTGLAALELLTEHTFFSASVSDTALDLSTAPWSHSAALWTHPSDHTATQALADAARERAIPWIRYASARDAGGLCAAVFDAAVLQGPDPASLQTWHCRTTRSAVRLVRGAERYAWVY